MDAATSKPWRAYADLFQVGARNMQNFALLKRGRADRASRCCSSAASAPPWRNCCSAAEYILAEGNRKVILCERGIRTFETARPQHPGPERRSPPPRLTHLPVIVDPSHATGRRDLVIPWPGPRWPPAPTA